MMNQRTRRRCFLTLLLSFFAGSALCLAARAPLQPPALTLEAQCAVPFANNAVLQQRIKLPVWGTSLPGAKVSVEFDGQTETTKAGNDGAWRVVLKPMDAVKLKSVNDCPEGKTMTISCEKDGEKAIKKITNLIMGDVWICAGQSNMAGAIKTNRTRHHPTNTLELATYPALRQWRSVSDTSWIVCAPDTAPAFKKVAFFFGRRLQQDALVPIGLIAAAVGGSNIESWLNQDPYARGRNYTRLIEPIVGYGVRGAIWYQGESNEKDKRGYQPKLESLITGWRKAWGQGDFPVYFVQLPGIGASSLENPGGGDGRAEIRQAYFETLAVKNTGMAVTIDVGAPGEHPPNKYDTGVRLARAALHNDYGFKDLAISPLYTGHKIEGDAIRIAFDHAENGLMVALKEGFLVPKPTPGVAVQWLSIQDKDGAWHWADGKIDPSTSSGLAADTLVVSCKDVKTPIAVRYAYTQHPCGNLLYNKDGQPVGPFSTNGYGDSE
ncbi:MAG: sialate O-acetylesterase [Candidatus Promineifilaceae bacterium]|jgi:sialate O-acetylesterase